VTILTKLEVSIFHLICVLPLPFRLLNIKNIHTLPNYSIDYLLKLTYKRSYILYTYTQPTKLASFLTLHIQHVKCEDSYPFYTTPG
jgi:hypothetical protein